MQLQCPHCGTSFRKPPLTRGTKQEFRALKSFLGSFMSYRLTMDELPNVALLKVRSNIIGSISTVPCAGGKAVYLTRLKVSRSFRRHGLAQDLAESRISELSRRGFERLWAVTFGKVPAHLLDKLGFRQSSKTDMLKDVPLWLIERYGKDHRYWTKQLPKTKQATK